MPDPDYVPPATPPTSPPANLPQTQLNQNENHTANEFVIIDTPVTTQPQSGLGGLFKVGFNFSI